MSGRCSASLKARRAGASRPRAALAGRRARDLVSVRVGHRAVEEAAGQQLDLGAGTGQRRRQGTVVGRRERRGVDELNAHRRRLWWRLVEPDLSYCVVNTNGRELPARLPGGDRAAPSRRRRARDPRARQRLRRRLRGGGARPRHRDCRLIELERRSGKAENDSLSCASRPRPATACCSTRTPSCCPGRPRRCSRRSTPTPGGGGGRAAARPRRQPGALRLALPRRRHGARRSPLPAPPADRPERRRRDPPGRTGPSRARCSCAARPPPRSATSTRTSSSTTTRCDFCRACATPAGASSTCPAPGRSTTTSSPPTSAAGLPRIVEFHRNRDLYMRKHGSAAAAAGGAAADRLAYAAAGAGRDSCSRPAGARLPRPRPPGAAPRRGEGLRELAERYSAAASSSAALGLVDLRGVLVHRSASNRLRHGPAPAGGLARGRSRPAARRGWRSSASQRALARRVRKPLSHEQSRVARARARPCRAAQRPLGRQQQLPDRDQRGRAPATISASLPHSYGTGNSRCVNDVHQRPARPVGDDQGEPGADDPQRRDQRRG